MRRNRKPDSEKPGKGRAPIKKLDAATRQLETAIDLWLQDKDLISICTLAHAAHEILRQISLAKKTPRKSLFDLDEVDEKHRKEFRDAVKYSPNFFKHGGSGENEVHYFPGEVVHFILMDAVHLYFALGLPRRRVFWSFVLWIQLKNPDLCIRPVEELFSKTMEPEIFQKLKRLKKREFFDLLLESLPADSA